MIPTVRDVARHAKVSISTVSRVINDSAPVSADKKERVVAAIKALKFTPNPAARRLLGQASRTIGVILPSITGEFFADLLYGLDAAAKQHDYLLMVSSSRRLENDFIAAFESMNRRVDGMVIMVPELTAERVMSLVNSVFPLVFLGLPFFKWVRSQNQGKQLLDSYRFRVDVFVYFGSVFGTNQIFHQQ